MDAIIDFDFALFYNVFIAHGCNAFHVSSFWQRRGHRFDPVYLQTCATQAARSADLGAGHPHPLGKFVLGSLNFGTAEDVEPQVQKAVDLVKPGGILYWRQNPGIGDHPWKGVEEIQFFPWTFELNYEWAKKYGCEVLECKWDAQSDRIYSEWKKL